MYIIGDGTESGDVGCTSPFLSQRLTKRGREREREREIEREKERERERERKKRKRIWRI